MSNNIDILYVKLIMKTILLKNSSLFLLAFLFLVVAGCDKDWEISPGIGGDVIQKKVDGIEFKFCLLNEEGEAATVFNEGENFSFYFSVTNNSNKKLYFYPYFAFDQEIDFCRIYDSKDHDHGKPFEFLGADEIGIGGYPFNSGDAYVFEQNFVDDRDSTWNWKHGWYESAHQKPLTKGDYYTEFKSSFKFEGDQPINIGTLSFKINLRIK